MVKAITFDCWDTLLADDPSRTIERKRYFGRVFEENEITISAPEIDDLFRNLIQLRQIQEIGLLHREMK